MENTTAFDYFGKLFFTQLLERLGRVGACHSTLLFLATWHGPLNVH